MMIETFEKLANGEKAKEPNAQDMLNMLADLIAERLKQSPKDENKDDTDKDKEPAGDSENKEQTEEEQ